jgi:hypothetical protein
LHPVTKPAPSAPPLSGGRTAYADLIGRLDPRDERRLDLIDLLNDLSDDVDHARVAQVLTREYEYLAHRSHVARHPEVKKAFRQQQRAIETARRKLDRALTEVIRFYTSLDGELSVLAAPYCDCLDRVRHDPVFGDEARRRLKYPKGPPSDDRAATYADLHGAGLTEDVGKKLLRALGVVAPEEKSTPKKYRRT